MPPCGNTNAIRATLRNSNTPANERKHSKVAARAQEMRNSTPTDVSTHTQKTTSQSQPSRDAGGCPERARNAETLKTYSTQRIRIAICRLVKRLRRNEGSENIEASLRSPADHCSRLST